MMDAVRAHRGKSAITPAARASAQAVGETMPGGRYPIRNGKDLENAYKDYIRTGRPSDVAAWIGKRAKALGLPNPITPSYDQIIDKHAKKASK